MEQNQPPQGQDTVFIKHGVAEDLDAIAAEFAALDAESRVTMPEVIFVDVFLPFFAGDENPKYKDVSLVTWLNAISRPQMDDLPVNAKPVNKLFQEVDVTDNAGRVLFTVPAGLDADGITPTTQTEGLPGMTHLVKTYKLYLNNSQAQADNYLNAELSRRPLIHQVPENVAKNLTVWNGIFKRYNRPEMYVGPEAMENKPASDVIEIEEF